MNLPESQSTKQKINKSAYETIRKRFKDYAVYWNAIWKVWEGTSPTTLDNAWGNFRHDEIPVSDRYTNKVEYDPNNPDQINPVMKNIESNIIETVSNQNIIREEVYKFNKKLMEKFGEYEYNSAGKSLYDKPIKSYAVNLITKDIIKDEIISTEQFFTNEYEKFSDDYIKVDNIYKNSIGMTVSEDSIPKIQLYKDENLTIKGSKIHLSLIEDNIHIYVKWTGARYYTTKEINQFTRISNEAYIAPTDMTNNDSKGLTVSSEDTAANTYIIFNGSSDVEIRDSNNAGTISSSRPFIIYFNTTKELSVRKYSLKSDANGSFPKSWTLEGSNTKDNWTIIDKRTNISFAKGETKSYSLTNNNYFQYYRLVITSYKVVQIRKRRIFSTRTYNYIGLRKFTFSGYTSYTTVNDGATQPQNMGLAYSGSMGNVKKYSEAMSSSPKDYQNFSDFISDAVPNTIHKNLKENKMYDRNEKITMNNIEQIDQTISTRQDDIIRKEDTEQILRVLDKINAVLKLRDNWFDKSGRCSLSCQVQCQHGCQVSCQSCNTHQCHNQKCGMH